MSLRSALCAVALIVLPFAGFGQEIEKEADSAKSSPRSIARSHNIYLDFFESSNVVSVSYDTRFPGSEVLGWHAGVGFSGAHLYDFLDFHPGVSIPLGINALFGHRASKFEIGVGAASGMYFYRDKEYRYMKDDGTWVETSNFVGPTHTQFACTLGINLGYRWQRRNGFGFRIGLSPCINVSSGGTYINLFSAMPYIGFGYTFR